MIIYYHCTVPCLPSARMRSEVRGSVCVCVYVRVSVCLSVCLSVTLHLTSRVFVRLTKDTTYLTGNEGQKFRTIFFLANAILSLRECACALYSTTWWKAACFSFGEKTSPV